MFRSTISRLAGTAFFAAALSANAALPTVTLSFDQSSGVVGPTDSVDVWVTLTVDANSSPLVFDASTPAPFGFAAGDLPQQGNYIDTAAYGTAPADFATYTYVQTNTYFGCSGTFATDCISGPPYDFTFHTTSEPGRPSFNFLSALSLQPGQSFSYLFGSFTPTAGVVPDGTYTFYSAGATLLFQGLDADGHDLYSYQTLGDTCPAGPTPGCAFTRTVVSVPEPTTWALMALGVLFVAFVLHRQRRG